MADDEHTLATRAILTRREGPSKERLNAENAEQPVRALDLVARTTALVCGRLRQGRTIDVKHATALSRLRGLGRPEKLATAWNDHRQQVPGTLDDASRQAALLLENHPELVVVEEYSSDPVPCERCRERGPFRPASSNKTIEILGYC